MKQIIPLGSHHISYNQPKVAMIEGYLNDVYGMILSDYITVDEDGKENHETTRTILIGEELRPDYHITTEEQYKTEVFFLPSTKILTLKQLNKCIQLALSNRRIGEMLADLKEGGFTTSLDGDVLELGIYRRSENEYRIHSGIHSLTFDLDGTCEPLLLRSLYNLQDYLRCAICLKNSSCANEYDVPEETLSFMNGLLKNQRTHGVWVANFFGADTYVNDGVYTYHQDGKKEAMSHEEFRLKYPQCFCIND